MLEAAMSGTIANCGGISPDENDPAEADIWGPDRTIRSGVIRWLCVDRAASIHVDPRGIQVMYARIDAELDLSFVSIPFPLRFFRCAIRGDINLEFGHIPSLGLTGCCIGHLIADGLEVNGSLFLDRGFRAAGEVRLLRAAIKGILGCQGGFFQGSEKALSCDEIQVDGDIFLNNGFQAEGSVRLLGAVVRGSLICSRGMFQHGTWALYCDRLQARGSVFLDEGFLATGEVRLVGAVIDGQLNCKRGRFRHMSDALTCDRIRVEGNVNLDDGLQASGHVRLLGAVIGGQFSCRGAWLRPSGVVENDGKALSCDGMKVAGAAFLDRGFRAEGSVRLPGVVINGDLACKHSVFGGEVLLVGAKIRGTVGFQGSYLQRLVTALNGDRMQVGGSAFLNTGFQAEGGVRLLGAVIKNNFDCSGGKFKHKGDALTCDRMQVGGDVLINNDFQAEGTVRLPGAAISGSVNCYGGIFRGEVVLVGTTIDGPLICRAGSFQHPEMALTCDGIQVEGGAFFDEGFQATGEVRLADARIKNQLGCKGGRFLYRGDALNCDRMRVEGGVFLTEGFQSDGIVRLAGAVINGQLGCRASRFLHPETALLCDGMQVKDGVILDEGFLATGDVQLGSTVIGGSLVCQNSTFQRDFLLQQARISGSLIWKDVHLDKDSVVDLSHTSVFQLDDSGSNGIDNWEQNWPQKGNLSLNGFSYGALAQETLHGKWVAARVKWIGLQPRFMTQPYEQLIKVLRQMGYEEEAKEIAIAKQEALRKLGDLDWWSAAWNWFLGRTIGHGYRPARLLVFGGFAIAVGALAFGYGLDHELLKFAGEPANQGIPNPWYAPWYFATFYALAYSVDTFLPIIRLGVTENWQIDTSRSWGHALMFWSWFGTVLGWFVSTLFVVAFTSLIRKD